MTFGEEIVSIRIIVILLLLPIANAAAEETVSCRNRARVEDASSDVTTNLGNLPFDAPEMDILSYEIIRLNGSLKLSLEFAGRPASDPYQSYRYWLGFHVRTQGGLPEYMDLRIAATTTYTSGVLVGPNSGGNQALATIEGQWLGRVLRFEIPWDLLTGEFGPGVEVGQPRASSDGIHRSTNVQGAMWQPYVQDWTMDFEEFRPLSPCPLAEGGSAGDSADRTSSVGFVIIALCFTAAALMSNRDAG